MSKTLGNLQEQLAQFGPDAVRVTIVRAGPPEKDIDWAGSVEWLAPGVEARRRPRPGERTSGLVNVVTAR